jgi:DNA-binding MarR family transcriptional regulator
MEETVSTAPDPVREAGTLLLLVRVVDQQLRAATAPNAITISDLSVLANVARGVDSPSLVARTLKMDPARVTHVVDGLVEEGALTREVDPSDRRRWQLALTDAGMRKLTEGTDKLRSAMEAALEGLTKEEHQALSLGIAGIRRVLQAQNEPAAAASAS